MTTHGTESRQGAWLQSSVGVAPAIDDVVTGGPIARPLLCQATFLFGFGDVGCSCVAISGGTNRAPGRALRPQ